jgi:hypothetical protein
VTAEEPDGIAAPERFQHCEEPFPERPPAARRGLGGIKRHRKLELLPLAVLVTEWQVVYVAVRTAANGRMVISRPACGGSRPVPA